MIELGLIAGAVLSVAFEHVPGLSTWYEEQNGQVKRLVMLILIITVALVVFGLSCAHSPYQYVQCSAEGAWELVALVAAAVAGNQTTHLLTKKKASGQLA